MPDYYHGADMQRINVQGNKVAVMSDIHSNYHAFRRCYRDALQRGARGFVFLGDYVSDLAETEKTMELVHRIRRRYPTVCLRGNREGYMLDHESGIGGFAPGSRSGSLLFTYDHLSKIDLDFFRSLKISDTIEINGVMIDIAHSTMNNDRYYFDSEDGHAAEIFLGMKRAYMITGHSHKQYMLQSPGKTIINPGSVGIPHGGTKCSQYALLEICDGNVTCALCEVRYDIEEVIRSQFASGLVDAANYWAIGILYDIITGEECVLRLLKLVGEADGIDDENAWRSAAISLGMKLTEQEIVEFYRKGKDGRRHANRIRKDNCER